MKRIALFVAAAALLAVSCEKTPEVTPEITTEATEILIPLAGSEDTPIEVKFSANVSWTAALEEEADWLVLSPDNGKAGNDIVLRVMAAENTATVERSAVIVITAGTAEKKIPVKQACVTVLTVSEQTLAFETAGSEKSFRISTNENWTVAPKETAEWLTITPKEGTAGSDVEIKVAATTNTLLTERTAELVITAKDKTEKVTVTQSGAPLVEKDQIWVAIKGESGEFAVNGGSFKIETDENDWLTASVEGGKVKYTATANTGFDYRSVGIKITSDSGAEPVTVYIFQNGRANIVWASKPKQDWTGFNAASGAKFALFGDYLLVANGAKAYVLNPQTGAVQTSVDMPAGLSADNLCVDAGGNILVAANANSANSDMFTIYTGKAMTDLANPKVVLSYNSANFWGATLHNLRVNGDISKDAVIAAYGGTGGIGYAITWEVNDGVVGDVSYENCPFSTNINCGVVFPNGTAKSDGLWFSGYNGDGFNFFDGTAWTSKYNTTSWDTNVNCMAMTELGGKRYLACVYGAFWSYTQPQIVITDITDVSNVKEIGRKYITYEYEDWTGEGSFSDIAMTGKDNTLHIWFNDTNYGAAAYMTVEL